MNDDDDFLGLPKEDELEAERMERWPYPLPKRDGPNYGRPRKYSSPEQFDIRVDDYINLMFDRHQRPTMTGLLLHLGLNHSSMCDYAKREEFSCSVSRARSFIKDTYEKELVRSQGSTQGVIFALKNFGRAEGDFLDVNKTELTGKDGRPLTSVNVDLDSMSDIEKASRLVTILQKASQQKEDDDGDS